MLDLSDQRAALPASLLLVLFLQDLDQTVKNRRKSSAIDTLARWKGCGLKPWEDPGTPAVDPGAWGAIAAGVRAARGAVQPGIDAAAKRRSGAVGPTRQRTWRDKFSAKDADEGFQESRDAHGVPRCKECGKEIERYQKGGLPKGTKLKDNLMELNHDDSVAHGGKTIPSNRRPVCLECNRDKADNDVQSWTDKPVDSRIIPYSTPGGSGR